MEPIAFTIAYCKAFLKVATQLNRLHTARQWAEMGVAPEIAGQWANKGYFPGEAKRHIEAGRTPDEANAYDAAELDKFVGDARAFEALRK